MHYEIRVNKSRHTRTQSVSFPYINGPSGLTSVNFGLRVQKKSFRRFSNIFAMRFECMMEKKSCTFRQTMILKLGKFKSDIYSTVLSAPIPTLCGHVLMCRGENCTTNHEISIIFSTRNVNTARITQFS